MASKHESQNNPTAKGDAGTSQQESAGTTPQQESAGTTPQQESAGTTPQQESAGTTPQQESAGATPQSEYKEYNVHHIDDTCQYILRFHYKQEPGDLPSFDLVSDRDGKARVAEFRVKRADGKSAVVATSSYPLSSQEVDILKQAKKKPKKGHYKVEIDKKAKLNLRQLFKPSPPSSSSSSEEEKMELQQ